MAEIGPFSDNLSLRLGVKLSLGQTPSAKQAVYIDVLMHSVNYISR